MHAFGPQNIYIARPKTSLKLPPLSWWSSIFFWGGGAQSEDTRERAGVYCCRPTASFNAGVLQFCNVSLYIQDDAITACHVNDKMDDLSPHLRLQRVVLRVVKRAISVGSSTRTLSLQYAAEADHPRRLFPVLNAPDWLVIRSSIVVGVTAFCTVGICDPTVNGKVPRVFTASCYIKHGICFGTCKVKIGKMKVNTKCLKTIYCALNFAVWFWPTFGALSLTCSVHVNTVSITAEDELIITLNPPIAMIVTTYRAKFKNSVLVLGLLVVLLSNKTHDKLNFTLHRAKIFDKYSRFYYR